MTCQITMRMTVTVVAMAIAAATSSTLSLWWSVTIPFYRTRECLSMLLSSIGRMPLKTLLLLLLMLYLWRIMLTLLLL